MLKIIPKLPLEYLGRYFGCVRTLPTSLTFSITYKCNFRCKTCNIWKDCYPTDELNLSQIKNIFCSIGKSLRWITLDGGEPFLREDLPYICEIIYKNCKPGIINIPSNGSLTEEIIDYVKRILRLCPNTNFIINLSLDHIGEKHDAIRGFKGAFGCLLETYNGLRNIKHPLLRVGINTVISQYNIQDWETIHSFVKKLQPDAHLFEIAQLRDEFRNKQLHHIVPSKKDSILLFKKWLYLTQINKRNLLGRYLYAIRKSYYSLLKKTVSLGRQVIPCFAAITSAYILPDGKVWSCCNNAWEMGNLKEYNFDLKRLWQAEYAKIIRRRIKRNKCFCIQANTNYLNLLHSPLYVGKLIFDVLF